MAIDWSKSLGSTNATVLPKNGSSGINWGKALTAPAAAPSEPRNSLENKLVSSFRSIDPNRRAVVLTSFQQQAKAGNKDAARRLELLAPHLDAPAPVTPDYAPKDFGSKLGSTLYDLGKGIVESAKTTGQTIATVPHAVNAAGISLASAAKANAMPKGQARTDFINKSKQTALNEINKTPYGKYFGKTVEETKKIPISKQLAGIGGTTLENVLNAATLGEGTIAEQGVKQVTKSIVGKEGATFARQVATKQALKGSAGYIRDLGTGQFSRTAIHPDDAAIMDQFIDYARGALKLNPHESKKLGGLADMLAEHYGVGRAATTDKQLASSFQKVLTVSEGALKRGVGEAGKIGLPQGLKPSGRLLTGSAGRRLLEGAKLGAGYGVAQAGQQNITDPKELAKAVGTSAVIGGALAAGVPAIGKTVSKVAKGVQKRVDNPAQIVAELRLKPDQFGSKSDYNNAIQTEVNRIKSNPGELRAIDEAYTKGGPEALTPDIGSSRPGHQAAIEAAVAKGDMGEVAKIINAMPESDPYKASMTSLFKDRVPAGSLRSIKVEPTALKPTKGTPLVQTQEQAAKGRAIAASNKQNLSSRVQQYESSLQASIKGIEESGGYQKLLAEHGGDKVIANKAVLQAAKELGPLDEKIVLNAKPLDKIDTVTLVRAKATLDSAAREFTDAWQGGKLSDAELTKMSKHISALEAGYKIMSAEPGRATQIQSTFIDDAFKRAQKLKELIQETKGATPEIRNQRIAYDLEAFDKAMAKAKQSGAFSKEIFTKIHNIVSEYATAAKLTSPFTHVVNIASNLLTLLQRGGEKTITTGWAALKGETSFAEVKNVFGTSQAFKNASIQFGKDVRQSFNPKANDLPGDMSKSEIKPAIPGVTGKVIRTPFNLLTAGDNFFKSILRDSELHSTAFTKGYQEGFRGQALDARIKELVASPTADMMARADKAALEFTFQDDPGIIANGISRILQKIPLLRLLVPFVKTPTNIVKFNYQRSPLGLFSKRNIQDVIAGGVERREAVARLGLGAGLSLGGVMAAFNAGDNITGAAPTDPGQKDLFYASGKKPYSIRIGGKWWAYNRFAPVGLYLTQGVGLRDALTNGESKTAGNLFSSMAVTTAKGLADLPFVSGVSNVIAAINDPANTTLANKVFGGILTGLIPNFSRDVANATDATPRIAKTIPEQVKAVIPGQKQNLPARQTVFGTEQVDTRTGLERGLLKITSNDQGNKLTKALDDIGRQTGYYPQGPKPTTKVNGQVLSPDQFLKYQKEAGTIFTTKLEKALMDAKFNQLSPDDKQRTLERMISESRAKAGDDVVGKQKKNPKHKIKSY